MSSSNQRPANRGFRSVLRCAISHYRQSLLAVCTRTLLDVCQGYFNLSPGEKWGQWSSLAHDLGVMDVFMALTQRGTLVLLNKTERPFLGPTHEKCGLTPTSTAATWPCLTIAPMTVVIQGGLLNNARPAPPVFTDRYHGSASTQRHRGVNLLHSNQHDCLHAAGIPAAPSPGFNAHSLIRLLRYSRSVYKDPDKVSNPVRTGDMSEHGWHGNRDHS